MGGTIGKLLLGRLLAAIATLWFVATMVFVITNLLPGDVAQELLGQSATPEAVAGLRKALGSIFLPSSVTSPGSAISSRAMPAARW